MHDNFWHHLSQEERQKTDGESEACPVVPVFHHLEAVAFKVNSTIKVHFMESLHWNFISATIFEGICLLMESKVILNGTTWVSSLLILAWSESRSYQPEGDENGDTSKNGEEYGSLKSTTDTPCEVEWDKPK